MNWGCWRWPRSNLFATLNEGDDFVGTELLDPALRDRFYVILMDYLPNEVEKEVLINKTHVSVDQADAIIDAVNTLRSNFELSVEVSTRTVLMIGEMVSAGATLKEALSTSLQTSKETLNPSCWPACQNGYLEKAVMNTEDLNNQTKSEVFKLLERMAIPNLAKRQISGGNSRTCKAPGFTQKSGIPCWPKCRDCVMEKHSGE